MGVGQPQPPRLYCIAAQEAPVAAVLRRGPSHWSHVGRWDLEALRYEPGGWLGGRIFPRRSDLSPDGRWLCYFAHKPSARWAHGDAYVAVSRLPWLSALHAFGTCGTWTRGYAFTPAQRDLAPALRLPLPWGLTPVPVVQFATERRRGWVEAADCPARAADDAWDVRREVRLEKRRPGGTEVLQVERVSPRDGEGSGEQVIDGMSVAYSLVSGGERHSLPELQWADWDAEGRLLAATRSGVLQVRRAGPGGWTVVFEEDLAPLTLAPAEPPSGARRW